MKKKVILNIDHSEFKMEFDSSFASYLEDEMDIIFKSKTITIKELLRAYIEKNFDMFQIDNALKEINEKIKL
jgi:hypothetical protein